MVRNRGWVKADRRELGDILVMRDVVAVRDFGVVAGISASIGPVSRALTRLRSDEGSASAIRTSVQSLVDRRSASLTLF